MIKRLTSISTGTFLFALICFIMPFVTVSCQNERIMSVSGVQLVTGFEIQEPGGFSGQGRSKRESPEPLAIAAGACVIAGALFGLMKFPAAARLLAAIGGAGFLVILRMKIDGEITRQGPSPLQVSYGIGYWLTLLSCLVAGGVNGMIIKTQKSELGAPNGPPR